MRYFMDSEFIERGPDYPIELISIGIIAEDGRELYAQSSQFNWEAASPWVRENVYPHLRYCSLRQQTDGGVGTIQLSKVYHQGITGVGYDGKCTFSDCPWRTRAEIKQAIFTFMDPLLYGKPEIWTYYGAYDHVAFCQLFGTMMDLPKAYPMHTMDLKQWCKMIGNPRLPEQAKGEHNALEDAKWVRTTYEFLAKLEQERNATSK